MCCNVSGYNTADEVHDPSTTQQFLTVIHMEQKKEKEDSALSPLIVNQHAPQRGLKKKVQVFFFSMAIKVKIILILLSFHSNKTFFHEIIIQEGNKKRSLQFLLFIMSNPNFSLN